jgi:transposase InsO family protein
MRKLFSVSKNFFVRREFDRGWYGQWQTFAPIRSNKAWVTDITYTATGEVWLLVAGSVDVFICELAGYSMDAPITRTLTAQAYGKLCPINEQCLD